MLKKIFTTIVLTLFSIVIFAQSNVIDIYPRQFSAIEFRGNIKGVISIADSAASTITLRGITHKEVQWRVKNNTLYVTVPSGILDKKGYAEVKIVQPILSKIAMAGAQIETLTPITGSSLAIETLGSVNTALLDIAIDNLSIISGGQSDIAVRGYAKNSNLNASLGSRIDGLGCTTDSVTALCNGTSEIYVNAQKYLNAKAILGGTIYFVGPAALQPKTSVGGGIIAIEDVVAPAATKRFVADTTIAEPVDKVTAEPAKIVKEKPAKEEKKKTTKEKKAKSSAEKPEQPLENSSDEEFF